MIFTTSWDDGYEVDTKVAALLDRFGMKGTFYLCPRVQHEQDMMTINDIHRLRNTHEIGAHTMTHPWLTRVTVEQARKEIVDSKKWIEDHTETTCSMFCYPYGDCNATVRTLVSEAGFTGGRVTTQLMFDGQGDRYQFPTSLQVAPFPWRKKYSRASHFIDPLGPWRVKCMGLQRLGIPPWHARSWLSLARALFDYARLSGKPMFHLWGHSVEIDRYDMWQDVETFFSFVANTHTDVPLDYATNGEAVAAFSRLKQEEDSLH